jgi:cation diffusion facilitator CzcD-associated flavoprotein CzcO
MKRFIPEPCLLDSPRQARIPVHTDPTVMQARTDALPDQADVVLIGAGPAGLAMASALWHAGLRDVVVLDAKGVVCGQFFDRVDTLGQRVLRSLYDHHPGVEGARDCELLDFARLQWAHLTDIERREIRMAQAGHRSVVPLDVFEAFCRHVVSLHDVASNVWRARVQQLQPRADEDVVVVTDRGDVRARAVVLCTGERQRGSSTGTLRSRSLTADSWWWVPASAPRT